MADNVQVKPSTASTAIDVATEEIDGTHFPIYLTGVKDADGNVQLVGYGDGIHIESATLECISVQLETIIKLQSGMLHLMEAVFEDSISARDDLEITNG